MWAEGYVCVCVISDISITVQSATTEGIWRTPVARKHYRSSVIGGVEAMRPKGQKRFV